MKTVILWLLKSLLQSVSLYIFYCFCSDFFLFSNRNLLYKLYYKRSITRRDYFSFSLIQAQLGCIPIQDFTLTQDTGKIFRNGIRITRCMVKFNPFFLYIQCKKIYLIWLIQVNHIFTGLSDFLASSKTNFSALLNSVILAKCFRCKLWENSLHVSKQLEKIGRYHSEMIKM